MAKEKSEELVIYKALYPGRTTFRYTNKAGNKKAINFDKGRTALNKRTDAEDIEFLEQLREQQRQNGKLEIFTVTEYEEKVTPDKTFVEFDDGRRVHKKVMIQAYEFALSKGFKPVEPKLVEPSSSIGKGIVSGKTATEGQK